MTDFNITNYYTNTGDGVLYGTAGEDRLIFTYTIADTGVNSSISPQGGGSYSGMIDGYYNNNVYFNGFENFTFNMTVNGVDYLVTGDGDDVFSTNGGNDTISSGAGIDQVDGGTGDDYWIGDLSALTENITINLNGLSTFGGYGSVTNIEGFNVTTGSGDDNLTAFVSSTANYGDVINAGDGDDTITLWLGGWDTVVGGLGSDRLVLTNQVGSGLGGVAMTGFSPTTDETGYSGMIDGYYNNNITFSGIEHFTFTDLNEGNDYFVAGAGDDSLTGGAGNDTLNSGSGSDTVDGGDGTDRWQADHSAVSEDIAVNLNGVSTLPGGGTLQNVEAMDLLTGSGDDTITGHQTSGWYDAVDSGAGDDLITLWLGGWDSVAGGTGSDRLFVTNALGSGLGGIATNGFAETVGQTGYSGMLDGYSSNNIDFAGIEHFTFIDENEGADNFVAGKGDDSLIGGGGNDTLNSGSGNDTVDGGTGTDRWKADHSALSENITVNLNGVSTLPGGGTLQNVEAMELSTGSGDDSLTGHETSGIYDIVDAGAGNDTISLWLGGWDTVHGGTGDDRLVVVNQLGSGLGGISTNGFSETGGQTGYSGMLDGYSGNNIDFAGIEHFTFTDLNDGNDTFIAGTGNDSLNGGGGDDVLNSGSGDDTVDGGAGTDRWQADHSALSENITVNLNEVSTLPGGGTLRNVEAMNLMTGSGDDSVTGHETSAQYDSVDAGAGDDTVTLWLGGWDTIAGGVGSDRLVVTNDLVGTGGVTFSGVAATEGQTGYSGMIDGYYNHNVSFSGIEHFTFTDNTGVADSVTTGTGDDSLSSGGGNDTLNSGAGNDTIDGGDGFDYWIADRTALTDAVVIDLNGVSTLPGGGTVQNIEGFNISTGSGNDSLTGHDHGDLDYGDVVNAGDGDDLITLDLGGWDTIAGEGGDDRLVVTNSLVGTGGVAMTGFTATGDGSTGYSGMIDGYYNNNISFSGIRHFTFTDATGTADNFVSGNGNDSLSGGGGNDTLNSGAGVDTIDGGDGNDFWVGDLSAATTNVVIDLNGPSSLPGGGSVQNIEGFNVTTGSGNDTLTSHVSGFGDYGDTVNTGDGNDHVTLYMGGWDTVAGGEGDDTLVFVNGYGVAGVYMSVSAGTSGYSGMFDGYYTNNASFSGIENFGFIDQSDGNDTITTGDGHDTLTGNGGNDQLFSGAGNDTVDGGDGDDYLDGGAGDDVIIGGLGGDTARIHADSSTVIYAGYADQIIIISADGRDTISGVENIQFDDQTIAVSTVTPLLPVNLTGTSGDDTLIGTLYTDTISGLEGNDSIDGLDSNDRLYGGDGDDTIIGGDGHDTITGDAGNDSIDGGAGKEVIDAGAGMDTVIGGGGIDSILGGDDNDEIYGNWGDDILSGGAGDDMLNGLEDNDLMSGDDGNDLMYGEIGNDTMDGGTGDDTLRGGSNHDSMFGGDGADLIRGQIGDDTIWGGAGNDTIQGDVGDDVLWGDDGRDRIDGRGHDDEIHGGADNDTLLGSYGRDTIFGDEGNDWIYGGAGTDTVYGGVGDDKLFGKGANDVLYGEDGADRLEGGIGDDTLDGGLGDDTLTGNEDADTFVFGAEIGHDVITDYELGVDSIQIAFPLWHGALDQARLDALADTSGPDLVLTFDNGDTLTLTGITTTAGLLDDISLL